MGGREERFFFKNKIEKLSFLLPGTIFLHKFLNVFVMKKDRGKGGRDDNDLADL